MADIELEWRLDITDKLATVIAELKGVRSQVDKQNGNVLRLWEHMNVMEQHPALCPIHDRIAELDKKIESDRASNSARDRESNQWATWVRPVLLSLLAFILGVLARKAL